MNCIVGELYYQHMWWESGGSKHAQLPEGLVMIRWSSMMAPNIFTPTKPFGHSLPLSPSIWQHQHSKIAASAWDCGDEQRPSVTEAELKRVSEHKLCTAGLICLKKSRNSPAWNIHAVHTWFDGSCLQWSALHMYSIAIQGSVLQRGPLRVKGMNSIVLSSCTSRHCYRPRCGWLLIHLVHKWLQLSPRFFWD